jgi:hypothetical protein
MHLVSWPLGAAAGLLEIFSDSDTFSNTDIYSKFA